MDRKDFLKKGLLGTGMFTAAASRANTMKNEIDEIEPFKPMDYPHTRDPLPNLADHSVLHPADSRGKADHGWLLSRHTFSFGNYHNPERMHFGVLRVLNDDQVDGGKGFGRHPHDNMEIISIPLEGDLKHEDSMGNVAVIRKGDIQVMSAGTGIMHAEFNKHADRPAKFLQIWVYPNKRNVAPRYDQRTIDVEKKHNTFQQILSPDPSDEGVWIHQDAWFHLGTFDAGMEVVYTTKKPGNGLYLFLIRGEVSVEGQHLGERDGFGVWEITELPIKTLQSETEILIMDVPMTLP